MAVPEFQLANPMGAFIQGRQAKQSEQSNALADLIRQRQLQEFDRQGQDREQQGQIDTRKDLLEAINWVNQGATDQEKAQRWDQAVDFYVKSGRPQAAQYKGRVDLLPMLVSQLPQAKPDIREVAPGSTVGTTTMTPEGPKFNPLYTAPQKPEVTKPPSGTLIELVSPQGQKQTVRQDDPQVDAMVKQGWRVAQKTGPDLTPQARTNAINKLQATRQIRQQLEKVKKAFTQAKGVATGPLGQGYLPTPAGQQFDRQMNMMAPLLRQLTRVPGEGSMSDYETMLLQLAQPQRTNYESVTAQQLQDIEDLVNTVETGYSQLLGEQAQTQPPGGAKDPTQLTDDELRKALGL